MEVNIHYAKTNLSKLLEKVAAGEEVLIAKAGRPVAKLVPFKNKQKARRIGSAKGTFVVPEDFMRLCQSKIIVIMPLIVVYFIVNHYA